ncbi:MAG TPA: site-specific integrase [Geomonas sp.]|nr:site-specific integrase [Geomonas sp.]
MPKTMYLYRVKQTYYFRFRIPSDLLETFPLAEVRRSLKTTSLTQARKLLKAWSYKLEHTFTLIRSGMLTQEQARSLAAAFSHGGSKPKSCDVGGVIVEAQPAVAIGATVRKHQLSKLIEAYIAEYKTTEKADGPSIYEIETKCWMFSRIVGDVDIRTITRETILDFLKVLKQLPRNMSKQKAYAGKTIVEVLEMQPTDTMSDTTIVNYMVRVNSFFTWAVRVGHIDRNPADGVKHGKTKLVRADELRKAYAPGDISRLVAAYLGMKDEEKARLKDSPDRFWIPLISMYSGMRLNEICQLNTHDVKQDEETEVWYFHVEITEGDDKMIKSAAARRKVPVHADLISLGLLEYRKSKHGSGAPRLWMNLKKTNRGYHKNFANWFLGNGQTKGFLRTRVTDDSKLNFHSFRHTFINELKQKRADERILVEIAGHSNKSMTFGRYGKPYGFKEKQAVVNMLDYPVNVEALKSVAQCTIA